MESEKKKTLAYDYYFPMESELDLHKALIMQYASAQLTMGKTPIILREQLVILLAIYLKHGYSPEAKKIALKVFGFKIAKQLDVLNHNLKKFGYLVEDTMNKRIKHLNKDLKLLKEYVDNSPGNQYVVRYIMYIKNNEN